MDGEVDFGAAGEVFDVGVAAIFGTALVCQFLPDKGIMGRDQDVQESCELLLVQSFL